MINPKELKNLLKKNSIKFFSGVPDSCCLEFCKSLETDKKVKNIVAINEGNAVAIGLGHYLSSKKIPCIYLQNSGLGNATDPLTNLCNKEVYNIPMLLLIGWRGAPGIKDEPQHIVQGRILKTTLKSFGIPNITLQQRLHKKKVVNLVNTIKRKKIIGAILIKPKTFEKVKANNSKKQSNNIKLTRPEFIEKLLELISQNTKLIGSVGFNSREIYQIRREKKIKKGKDFFLIGGMGHTFAVSQAIANNDKKNQIVCVDGDGSFLMHLGSFLTNKISQKNLKYILINNNSHESIGNIELNKYLDFRKISNAINFKKYFIINDRKYLKKKLSTFLKYNGPAFLEAKVSVGTLKSLLRPKNFINIKNNFIS